MPDKKTPTIGDRVNVGQFLWSVLTWLIDKWPSIVSLGAGGLMFHLASITSWLDSWGPVGWGGVAIGAALTVYLALSAAYAAVGWGRLFRSKARLGEAFAERTDIVNPLDTTFERRRIDLAKLYHPYFRPIERATFRECEFFGPAGIFVAGGQMLGTTHFTECQCIIVRDDAMLTGVTFLIDCHFTNCHFWRVPLYMKQSQWNDLRELGNLNLATYEAPIKQAQPPTQSGRPAR